MKIRRLQSTEDFLAAERFQKIVWDFPDREIIPLNEMTVLQRHGGIVFGAFDGGTLASFCCGQPAFQKGKTYHYSRILGVLPSYQNLGLGYTMKCKQRNYVRAMGLDLIRWTFDPLQSRNAFFNIRKLGCIVRDYYVNLYPGSGSRFNQGMDTDRVVPEWWIQSRHVREKRVWNWETFRPVVAEVPRVKSPKGTRVFVEIPSEIDKIKKKDMSLAVAWRKTVRRAFLDLLRKGYTIVDFARAGEEGRQRSFYLFVKGFELR